ncbi:transporter substrate-binding domain-containing protein (plasmid) [Skermanella sp. TT6]|uniref:Transporter substrate-binding domain-containing protein n=1 Tax=Skermanella cutis TaxID=2775420 RepID=A0ABX7BFB3_9PROT|nr:transporter substrate-binding domain-containing protein [Skermanella sp. TT6]
MPHPAQESALPLSQFVRLLKTAAVVFAAGAASSPAFADQLDDIRKKQEIVIGTEAQFPPFEYLEDGKIVGYASDLLQLVAADLPGVRLNQLDVPWPAILPGLSAGKFDFVVTSVTVTRERAEQYAFTVPIAEATVALVKRKGDTSITKPEDIAGKAVGSQTASAQLKALQAFDEKLRGAGAGVDGITEYVSFDEAYADLAAGRIDAVSQALSNLAPLVKARGDMFEIVGPTIGPKTYYAWAGRKDPASASLVKLFSDGIAKANASGKMAELQMKWFGFTMEVPADAVPEPTM